MAGETTLFSFFYTRINDVTMRNETSKTGATMHVLSLLLRAGAARHHNCSCPTKSSSLWDPFPDHGNRESSTSDHRRLAERTSRDTYDTGICAHLDPHRMRVLAPRSLAKSARENSEGDQVWI